MNATSRGGKKEETRGAVAVTWFVVEKFFPTTKANPSFFGDTAFDDYALTEVMGDTSHRLTKPRTLPGPNANQLNCVCLIVCCVTCIFSVLLLMGFMLT